MEVIVEEVVNVSVRCSKWKFMGVWDVGFKEELWFVYGVVERIESDGVVSFF